MVVMTSCDGDIEGAARAVASAAADGDLQSFGAGLTVGATALAGVNHLHACAGRKACMLDPAAAAAAAAAHPHPRPRLNHTSCTKLSRYKVDILHVP